mmetsp:Transcript_7472/g.10121  ORF Transcript_7472/g.10121 Transcript_7472/m.10121 type:complete len:334 (-) Transcript_7472:299-1300(-)
MTKTRNIDISRRKIFELVILCILHLYVPNVVNAAKVAKEHHTIHVLGEFWKDFYPALNLVKEVKLTTDNDMRIPESILIPITLCVKEVGKHEMNLWKQVPFKTILKSGKLKYVINCSPGNHMPKILPPGVESYNVTWAAVSYFIRSNNPPEKLLQPLQQIIDSSGINKTKDCSFLYTNKGFTGKDSLYRWKFKSVLKKELSVEQPKGFLRYGTKLFDEAVELHSPYIFNIAFENTDSTEYISEKIVNAFLAGCIPVYWGTEDVFKYFNRRAMIPAKDFPDLDSLAAYVGKVHRSLDLRKQYLSEPPCTNDGFHNLFWWKFLDERKSSSYIERF